MRIGRKLKPPPELRPQLAEALQEPIERLKRGEAGITLEETPHTKDVLESMTPEELRLARKMIIDADPEALKLSKGFRDNATRGAATPERIIKLLSGELHGHAELPADFEQAIGKYTDALVEAWHADGEASEAEERLGGALGPAPSALSPEQQHDVEKLFASAGLAAERDRMAHASHGFEALFPGGAPVFSERVLEIVAAPLSEGGPALHEHIADLLNGEPSLKPHEVPVLLDLLYNLNAYELKQVRRALAPTKEFLPRYEKLGEENPLKGRATPEKIIRMLGGIGYDKPPLPTTEAEARQDGLEQVATALAGVKIPTARDQQQYIVGLSYRGGVKKIYSYGAEQSVIRTRRDRETGKRKWQPFNQIFLRTPVTLSTFTWGKDIKAKGELGVNGPFVYGTVGNPVTGPRAGFFIPLVFNTTISENGTVGFCLTLKTPFPFVHVGVSVYVTDPRLTKYIDPVLAAKARLRNKMKPITSPVADAWEAVAHHRWKKPKQKESVDWSFNSAPAQKVDAGETLTIDTLTEFEVGGRKLEIALAPGAWPVNLQVQPKGDELLVFIDGAEHALPVPEGGQARIAISNEEMLVQLDDGSGSPKGMKVER
jgi:hypothetical protein